MNPGFFFFRMALTGILAALPGTIHANGERTYSHGDPTDQEQLMLELVNRARSNPPAEARRLGIDLNEGLGPGTIDPAGVPPLAPQPNLFLAARRHSAWMLDNDIFSHTGKNGDTPGDRMAAAGYQFSGAISWAENIAWGGTSGTPDFNRESVARHEGLFLSSSHRINILGTNNTQIGLGILAGSFDGWNAVMATQVFARSGTYPETLLLGVVFKDKNGNSFYDPGEGIPDVTVTPDSGGWKAITSASGGYAVPYTGTSGSLAVSFSGLPDGEASRSVTKTGTNLKLDLEVSDSRPAAPEIAVFQPARSSLIDGNSKKSFGILKIRSGKRTKTFTLRNMGTAPLSGLRIRKSGVQKADFRIEGPAVTSLAPGKSATFRVSFKPTSTGVRKAALAIFSNDADESPFDITLRGRGAKN